MLKRRKILTRYFILNGFFLFLFLPLTVCPLPAPRAWCDEMIRLKLCFFPSCSKLSLRGSPSEPPPVVKNGGVIFYKSHGFLLGERRGCPCGIHRAMEQCPGSTPFLPSLDADDVPLCDFSPSPSSSLSRGALHGGSLFQPNDLPVRRAKTWSAAV